MTRTPMTTSMIAWNSMTRTPTSMIAWHCTMRTPLTTSTEWSARIVSSLLFSASHHLVHTHSGSRRLSPFTSTPCAWSSVRSLHLDSPFLFPALPHVPYHLPPVPEVRGKPAQLHKREYGLHRRVLPLHRL